MASHRKNHRADDQKGLKVASAHGPETEDLLLICPQCGDPADLIWVYKNKYYCSTDCVRKKTMHDLNRNLGPRELT